MYNSLKQYITINIFLISHQNIFLSKQGESKACWKQKLDKNINNNQQLMEMCDSLGVNYLIQS